MKMEQLVELMLGGSAPGTRGNGLAGSYKFCSKVHAVVLSGGVQLLD